MATIRGIMSAEFDYELTADQWEALKALRLPVSKRRTQNRFVIDRLVALELAAIINDCPDLTEKGRKALVRGSSRLWDVAA
jgi:spore maturation protein CgeB